MYEPLKVEVEDDNRSVTITMPNGNILTLTSMNLCIYEDPTRNPKLIYTFD